MMRPVTKQQISHIPWMCAADRCLSAPYETVAMRLIDQAIPRKSAAQADGRLYHHLVSNGGRTCAFGSGFFARLFLLGPPMPSLSVLRIRSCRARLALAAAAAATALRAWVGWAGRVPFSF